MTQLAEIRSNDSARAACVFRLYPWLTAHALSAVGRPFVWPADAPQHADRRPGWTSGNIMGGSVAEFVDEHGSGTVGYISRDGWPCATASRMTVGLDVRLWHHCAPRLSDAPVCIGCVRTHLGRAKSVARPRAVRGCWSYVPKHG